MEEGEEGRERRLGRAVGMVREIVGDGGRFEMGSGAWARKAERLLESYPAW